MHTQTHQHTCIHTHTFLCSSYFIQIGRPPFELKSLLWKHTPNGAHQEGQGSCRRAKTEARGRFVRWVFDLFLSGECWSFEISNSTLHVRVLLIIWDLTAQMSMCGFCWSFEILQLRCSCVGFADHLRSCSSTVQLFVYGFCQGVKGYQKPFLKCYCETPTASATFCTLNKMFKTPQLQIMLISSQDEKIVWTWMLSSSKCIQKLLPVDGSI